MEKHYFPPGLLQPIQMCSVWTSGSYFSSRFLFFPALSECFLPFGCFLPFASVFRAHSSLEGCCKPFQALSILPGPDPEGEGAAGT